MRAVLGYAEHVDMPLCGNRGKVSGSCPTDEDVGSRFVRKRFDVRLFEGVHPVQAEESLTQKTKEDDTE